MTSSSHIEMYKAARLRVAVARLRGEDTEVHEGIADALLAMMSEAERRTLMRVGEPHESKAA